MKRWIFRICLFLIVVIALIGAAVHITLRTDFPRRVVISIAQQQTGLRIEADELRTGWSGRTTIENLTVTLPLEVDPFLTVPRVSVSHTNLIKLLLTQRIDIERVRVDQPAAVIKRDDRGIWNILQAADIVAAAQGPVDPQALLIEVLPHVIIHEARFDVQGPDGAFVRYEPLAIVGIPDHQLVWQFEVTIEPRVAITGRIAPRAAWSHAIAFDVDEIPKLIEPWIPELPEPLRLAGVWQGNVRDATLNGQLTFSELLAGDAIMQGDLDLTVDGSELVMKPTGLHFSMVSAPAQQGRISGGSIRTDGRSIRIEKLIAEAMDTIARISADYDRDEETGRVRVRWQGRLNELDLDHEGQFTANLDLPRIGRRSMVGMLTAGGESPFGTWESTFDLEVSGHDWRTLKGRAAARRMHWVDEEGEVDLAGLAVRLVNDWPTIKLSHLTIPDAHVRGGGSINMNTLDWHVDVQTQEWMLPRRLHALVGEIGAVDLAVDAAGSGQRIDVADIKFRLPPHELHLTGRYWPDEELPLSAALEASTRIEPGNEQDLGGRIEARLDLAGRVNPLDLSMVGEVRGRELQWLGTALHPVDLPWRGTLDKYEMRFTATDLIFADGKWTAEGRYVLDDALIEASLRGSELSIERLIDVAGLPVRLAGQAAAEIAIVVPQLDFNRLDINGTWTAEDLTGHTLDRASGRGSITLRDRLARLHKMTLSQDDGTMIGELRVDLDHSERIEFDLTMRDWITSIPLATGGNHAVGQPDAADETITALTGGSASMRLHLLDLTASGEMDMTMDLTLRGNELGVIAFEGRMDQRDLHLAHFTAEAFGGRLDGSGTLVLRADQWLDSRLAMDWSNVDLSLLSRHLPALEPLRGISGGNLSMLRATSPRPPEPMRFEIVMDVEDGAFDVMALHAVQAEAFVGPDRAIVDTLRMHLADGAMSIWGRASRHGEELFLHGEATLDRLDLDQIVRTMHLADEPTPGRISGSVSAGGYPLNRERHRLFGTGRLQLAESDLVNMPGIAELFGALRLEFGTPDPRGEGEAVIRLEGDALEIAPLTYFNRGVDIAARLRIENIWLGEDSPIRGQAGGVVRPLRDSPLPFVGRLDRIIGAVQTDAASVRIGGTLAEREVEVVPLAEITGALRRILGGSVD